MYYCRPNDETDVIDPTITGHLGVIGDRWEYTPIEFP